VTAEIAALLDKATRGLDAARVLLERGDLDFAVSRAYYAMFHAATALLRLRQMTFSRHAAIIAAFGREFVLTGLFPREHHKLLIEALELRQLADYGAEVGIGAERARRLVDRAAAFVRDADAHVRSQGGSPA
jgi:uncharacterized protein (UPF0332 family)